jgi:hypothetical protein
MSWQVDNSRGPEWSGRDSIYNMQSASRWMYLGGGIAGLLLCVVVMGGSGDSRVEKGLNAIFGLLVLMPSIGMASYGLMLFPKWFTEGWRLTANANRLHFHGERKWSVRVDHIDSVEVGRTIDWVPSRSASFGDASVSQYEWQVFLFLTDGSRVVIYSVNADRESAATLAASIKSWLDRCRAKPPVTFWVEPEAGREGFAF